MGDRLITVRERLLKEWGVSPSEVHAEVSAEDLDRGAIEEPDREIEPQSEPEPGPPSSTIRTVNANGVALRKGPQTREKFTPTTSRSWWLDLPREHFTAEALKRLDEITAGPSASKVSTFQGMYYEE